MGMDIGQSFSPTDAAQQNQQQTGQLTPVQQAIKILSLRIPHQGGASAITPNALLTAPGAAGLVGGPMDIMAILRRLLQPGGGVGPAPAGLSNAPVPNVTPGGPPGLPSMPFFGAAPPPPPPSMTPLPGPGTPTTGPGDQGPVFDRTNPTPRPGAPTFHTGNVFRGM